MWCAWIDQTQNNVFINVNIYHALLQVIFSILRICTTSFELIFKMFISRSITIDSLTNTEVICMSIFSYASLLDIKESVEYSSGFKEHLAKKSK